jgi:drug/metabolite transporter (DMT)-like permease
MTPVYLISSACLAAFANFFFRRNLEKGGTSSAFLSLYFLASLILSFAFNHTLLMTKFSPVMTLLGCFSGFLNFMMLTLTAKSFELGPPGLTLTFQNASCIFPGLLLCLLFGPSFGFFLTPWLIVGFIFIVLGLYLSSRTYGKLSREAASVSSKTNFNLWLLSVISVMLLQGLILTLFQWRVLLFNCDESAHWLIPWSCLAEEDVWFIPAFFMVPALSQLFFFWKNERRKFSLSEMIYGLISGGLNCVCTVLLLLATKTVGTLKKEMLFPLFTISVILLCNIWGMKIYKEKVNWVGIIFCILGVLIGLIQ